MSTIFSAHLREVSTHYADRDYHLAHRRLLDAAIETRQPDIFRLVLDYEDWIDRNEGDAQTEQAASKALEILQQIEQAGPAATGETVPSKILSVAGVGKEYSSGTFALSDVHLELHTGGIIGLVGENGNGKTTLLRLIATELKPDSGTIAYPFISNTHDDYDLRTRLVYIEQRIPRWWGSLMSNLQFALVHYGIRGEDNDLWAEMMIARMGLRPYRHMTWSRLSSGYRTRFELAKTLLRQPKILLLDEPLANLDILAQQTILQDLKYMSRSITAPFGMILSSQHIYEVEKVSDRIIFLKNGVPQYSNEPQAVSSDNTSSADKPLIYEIETTATRDELAAAFGSLQLSSLHFNGGVFLVQLAPGTPEREVLKALADSSISLQYLRNISHSSRRFFLN